MQNRSAPPPPRAPRAPLHGPNPAGGYLRHVLAQGHGPVVPPTKPVEPAQPSLGARLAHAVAPRIPDAPLHPPAQRHTAQQRVAAIMGHPNGIEIPAHDTPPSRDLARFPTSSTPTPEPLDITGQRSALGSLPVEQQQQALRALYPHGLPASFQHSAQAYIDQPQQEAPHTFAGRAHAVDETTRRGANLLDTGVPLAAVNLTRFGEALAQLPRDRETNILAGMPNTNRPDGTPLQATWANELMAAAQARGQHVPANASWTDLVNAAYGPKPDGWSGVLTNLPRDIALTPLYTAEGGYALGHATREAAQGNLAPLGEVTNQAADIIPVYGHFERNLQQHPFQTTLAALGAAEGLGALAERAGVTAGRFGAAGAERVVPVAPEVTSETGDTLGQTLIRRGTYSQNPYHRVGEYLNDQATRFKGPGGVEDQHPIRRAIQKQALGKQMRRIAADEHDRAMHQQDEITRPVRDAYNQVGARGAQRVLETYAHGVTPEELAAYRARVPGPEGDVAAPVAGSRAMSEPERAYFDAARQAEAANTAWAQRLGLLSEDAARRRNVLPLAHVRAAQGDPLARIVLEHEDELGQLRRSASRAPSVDDAARAEHALEQRITREQGRVAGMHQARADQLSARIKQLVIEARRDPRVKTKPVEGDPASFGRYKGTYQKLARRRAFAQYQASNAQDVSNAVTRGLQARIDQAPAHQGALAGQLEQARAERADALRLFEQEQAAEGRTPFRVPHNPEPHPLSGLLRRYQRPSPTSLTGAKLRFPDTGESFHATRFQQASYAPITHDAFLREFGAAPHLQQIAATALRVLDPETGLSVAAEPGSARPAGMAYMRPYEHGDLVHGVTIDKIRSFISHLSETTDVAPATPGGRWVDARAIAELQKLMDARSGGMGDLGRRVSQAGRVMRNLTINAKLTHPTTNLLGNTIQAGVYGAGVASHLRAIRQDLPIPDLGVNERGFSATQTSRLSRGSFRNAFAEKGGGVLGAANTAAQVGRVYLDKIRRATMAIDNEARRAVYFRHAVGEARRAAHPNAGLLKRVRIAMGEVDAPMRDYLDAMARGDTKQARLARDRAMSAMNRSQGDFASMRSHPLLDALIPFHRWYRFTTRLLAETSLRHPGRMLALYTLGRIGQEAQNQYGGSLAARDQGSIPFGAPSAATLADLAYPNTYATLGSFLEPAKPSQDASLNPSGAIGLLNPFLRIPLDLANKGRVGSGSMFTDRYGRGVFSSDAQHPPDPNASDKARVILGEMLSSFGGPTAAFVRSGQTGAAPSTSLPIPGLTQQYAKKRATPDAELAEPLWMQLANLASPVRLSRVDLPTADQQAWTQLLKSQMGARNAKLKANWPADQAAYDREVAEYGRILDWLERHPAQARREYARGR